MKLNKQSPQTSPRKLKQSKTSTRDYSPTFWGHFKTFNLTKYFNDRLPDGMRINCTEYFLTSGKEWSSTSMHRLLQIKARQRKQLLCSAKRVTRCANRNRDKRIFQHVITWNRIHWRPHTCFDQVCIQQNHQTLAREFHSYLRGTIIAKTSLWTPCFDKFIPFDKHHYHYHLLKSLIIWTQISLKS